MHFSEDRLTHLAHLIHDGLYKDDLVDYPDEDKALREIKKVLMEYLHLDEAIDETVRAKITSQRRGIAEGSREWEILYKKYFEEELNKKRF
ncbi:MAG: DUF507 family protein [Deltaproteobacteria bacterium]|nr:DUF507 family protein [Deltaproteobacteria bacterium]